MVKTKRVVVLGASGAVGSNVVSTLQAMPEISQITLLVRRPFDELQDGKLMVHIVDVLDQESYSQFLDGHQVAICTFGIGQPTKVPREEFQKVDHDAVLEFAQACKARGVAHFELLGSVAANPTANNFYLKSKGALREAIAALGFQRFSTFQPSMLLTRNNRYGFSQGLMLALWPALSLLLVGGLKKYRGVRVEELGRAMAVNVLEPGSGNEILHWPEFTALAQR